MAISLQSLGAPSEGRKRKTRIKFDIFFTVGLRRSVPAEMLRHMDQSVNKDIVARMMASDTEEAS